MVAAQQPHHYPRPFRTSTCQPLQQVCSALAGTGRTSELRLRVSGKTMKPYNAMARAIVLSLLCAGMLVTIEGKQVGKVSRSLMQAVIEPQADNAMKRGDTAAVAATAAASGCTSDVQCTLQVSWTSPTGLLPAQYTWGNRVVQCTTTTPCPCQIPRCGQSFLGRRGCYNELMYGGYCQIYQFDSWGTATGILSGTCSAGYCIDLKWKSMGT